MKLTSVSESGRMLRRSAMFAGFILLAVSGLHVLASWSFNTCTWLVDGVLLGWSPGASVSAQVAVAVVILGALRMFLPGALLHTTLFVGYDSRGHRGRGGCLPAVLSTPLVYLAQLSVALLSGIDILATVLDLDDTRSDAKCDSVRRIERFATPVHTRAHARTPLIVRVIPCLLSMMMIMMTMMMMMIALHNPVWATVLAQ